MPLSAEELVERAIDQRKRGRLEEALATALAATQADENDANAWWQVSVCRWLLRDTANAISALRVTVALAPRFGAAWTQLGHALIRQGDEPEATEAFETAFKLDPDSVESAAALAEIYAARDSASRKPEDDEKELSVLTLLDRISTLSSDQLNRIGILHYQSRNYFEAIKYWATDAMSSNDPANLFNLGLAYNQSEVSQDADAVDMWRLALKRFPEFTKSRDYVAEAMPRLLDLAAKAREQGETLLAPDQWYLSYVNPFELLAVPASVRFDELDATLLQRLKKSLLREIELEDGKLSWMHGCIVDKSKAIMYCDELSDERRRRHHWTVFNNKPLLAFLTRGCHDHFLVNEHESPLDLIELLEDTAAGFRRWLSEPFARKFDVVLSKAIDQRNLVVIECLLDGRRWVALDCADKCFENTRRVVDRMLNPLRELRKSSETQKPEVLSVRTVLERDSLCATLNLLPSYFSDLQNEAVACIRDLAIDTYNIHSDSDRSSELFLLTEDFKFKSAHLNHQLAEDLEKLHKLISEEKADEVRLTKGSCKWEITKKHVQIGTLSFPVTEAAAVRWGGSLLRDGQTLTSRYLVAVKADDGREARFEWDAIDDQAENQRYFDRLINAALTYVFPTVVGKCEALIKRGHVLHVGKCLVSDNGLEFETTGWIFTKKHTVPWNRGRASVENGDLVVFDAAVSAAKITLPMQQTDNAAVLQYLIRTRADARR
jgi:tetratricopeptide (TPR) repeat protein